jgi:hypothetical protein
MGGDARGMPEGGGGGVEGGAGRRYECVDMCAWERREEKRMMCVKGHGAAKR